MAQLIMTPAEKRWEHKLLFFCRNNDFHPIPFHTKKKKKKMAAILEIFRIAVQTDLLMLVIRLTERKKM